jgi:uncharacterized protein HemY
LAISIDSGHQKASELLSLCMAELRGENSNKMDKSALREAVSNRDWKKAIQAADKLPDCAVKYNMLGCLYAIRKKYGKARRHFASAFGKDMGDSLAGNALAQLAEKSDGLLGGLFG